MSFLQAAALAHAHRFSANAGREEKREPNVSYERMSLR